MKNYFVIILLFIAGFAEAQTKVIVRAKAKDAKFIGSSIGGAKVIIRESVSGRILAEGITSGSTGNTEKIMKKHHERYGNLSDNATAKFEASLDIEDPVFIEIEVFAPYNQKQATARATTQLWVIPGEHITGDGVVVEIPGFIVNVLSPQTHESISKPKAVELVANVVMMCGCTISEGGLWDAGKITVKAIIKKDGVLHKTVPLQITEKNNTFGGSLENSEPGLYEIIIYAFDSRTGNSGLDKVNIIIN